MTGIEGAEDGTVYLRIPRDLSLDEVSLQVGVGETSGGGYKCRRFISGSRSRQWRCS